MLFYILNKRFNLLLSSLLLISGCKYNVYTNNDMYKQSSPVVYIHSYNPYGYITIMIKEKLRMHGILYNDYKKNIECTKSHCTILYLLHSSERFVKTALFQNGEPAEYKLVLTVHAKIKTYDNKYQSFDIRTSRAFFDNPMMISSNFVKKNYVRQIIYEETAEKLINKLFFK